jgi:hypothetical protein
MPRNKNIHMVGLVDICLPHNMVFFEKKEVRSPVEIICLASAYLNYWVGLQKDKTKENI